MLPLALDLCCDHLLLLRTVDRALQIGPGCFYIVHARCSERFQERKDLLAVLNTLGRVD